MPLESQKRIRKRYDPARRREVAATRRLGACHHCRSKKIRCLHAQENSLPLKSVLRISNTGTLSLSTQVVNDSTSPHPNVPATGPRGELEAHDIPVESMGDFDYDGLPHDFMAPFELEREPVDQGYTVATNGSSIGMWLSPLASIIQETGLPSDKACCDCGTQATYDAAVTVSQSLENDSFASLNSWDMNTLDNPSTNIMQGVEAFCSVSEVDIVEARYLSGAQLETCTQVNWQWPNSHESLQSASLYSTFHQNSLSPGLKSELGEGSGFHNL